MSATSDDRQPKYPGGSANAPSLASLPARDYIAPGLARVMPDAAFPHMRVGDVTTCTWPYLRKEIPHNWYVDDRFPVIGFLSRDEANLLHNIALLGRGRPALEIGAWRGWSAAHMALAGVTLDVIDPMFVMPEHRADVAGAMEKSGVGQAVTLYDGYSPARIKDVAAIRGEPWSVIFIDGDHEGDAPMRDAAHAIQHAADDCVVIFHDLVAPDVARGLDYLRRLGWNTLVYQTMQIMGVAWRGNMQMPTHIPDPAVAWNLPHHLHSYRVSGEREIDRIARQAAWAEATAAGPDYHADYLAAAREIRALRAMLSHDQ